MTGETRRRAASALAVVAALAWCALFPYRVTDGDSCVYGALAHDMAAGGPRAWFAPVWDVAGTDVCFHEHPPGAFWLTAVVELIGVSPSRAVLVANALWQFAAFAGVVALARRFVSREASLAAGLAFLLHIPALKYVQRGALEFPLAATSAWTLAAALRLGCGRAWVVVLAASLACAFLVRGAMAAVPAAMLAWIAVDPALRPPLRRLAAAVALAAVPLVAFDRLHAAQTGHGFWLAYLDRQVFPSFEPGGTSHSEEGSQWAYFAGRLVLYTLPWSLLAILRLARGPRPLPAPAAWRLAAAWIAATFAGAAMTTRPASRYLFEALPPSALLVGLALAEPPRFLARTVGVLAVLAVPLLVAGKSLFRSEDRWTRAAGALEELRESGRLPEGDVVGRFPPEDGRTKAFLRFHLGRPVRAESAGSEPPGTRWLQAGVEPIDGDAVLVRTELGTLVVRRR